MSQRMKCNKLQSEVRYPKDIDRISSLPNELLTHILSFLPTTTAVKTSILSTRWRHLFTLATSLSFVFSQGSLITKKEREARWSRFKMFVCNVLMLHNVSPIKKFKLHCEGISKNPHLHAWISAALLKGVQDLDLGLYQCNTLPSCLFNCRTLVALKIDGPPDIELKVPGSVCLPSLKVLHLGHIRFLDGDLVSKFFTGCLLLEKLTLQSCTWPTSHHVCISAPALRDLTIFSYSSMALVEIDAPSLAYLTYSCSDDEEVAFCLKNARSLVKVEIKVDECYFASNHRVLQLFRGAYNVMELHLLGFSLEVLFSCVGDLNIPAYRNLAKLHLCICSYKTWKYVTYWLDNSPQLETVVFERGLITPIYDDDDNDDHGVWPSDVALAPFSSNVKVIEVKNFWYYEVEQTLLEYLLQNAKLLNMVILHKLNGLTEKQELSLSKKLLMLPRASKHCRIQLI